MTLSRIKPLFDLTGIASLLAEQPLVITANRRLMFQVRNAFDQWQADRGETCWPALEILSIDDWIDQCWHDLLLQGWQQALELQRLDSTQELLLWEQIIRQESDSLLLKTHSTAKTAQSAYRTLRLWQTQPGPSFNDHPDCTRFVTWLRRFEHYCRNHAYIAAVDVAVAINSAFAEGELAPYPRLLALGFQQTPPLYAELFDNAAISLPEPAKTAPNAATCAVACDSAEQEMMAAAGWARQRLERDPEQRIAIIIPDLKQRREQAERLLSAEFEPQYALPYTPRYQTPFNISAGVSLSEVPLINTGLALIETAKGEPATAEWLRLMRSPFVHRQTDWPPQLCQVEEHILASGYPRLPPERLTRILRGIAAPDEWLKDWLSSLSNAERLRSDRPGQAPLQHWISHFNEVLDAFGWPGARRLDSVEYQQLKRWQDALNEILSVTPICGPLTLEQAVTLLRRYVGAIEFQAESPAAPIQVLGVLESSGLHFDAIWLMGMNNQRWPPPPAPNPFIPITLQRAAAMPHASAERELQFTRMLFDDYRCCTAELVASYALREQDQDLSPSQFIRAFPNQPAEQWRTSPFAHPYYQTIYYSRKPEALVDTCAPSLPRTQFGMLRGGTQIIKNQAACPFRAFALHRLNAKELDSPTIHIGARERGTMLHRALELLWRGLGSWEQLDRESAEQLSERIEKASISAVLSQAERRPDLFSTTMIRLETARLKNLLAQWLTIEQRRIPFTLVETEATRQIELAGVKLRVRIDRIDRLQDGGLALIDYKTGHCSVNQWQGERPEEPQLPLYAVSLLADEPVRALAFAQINIDKRGFIGVAQQEDIAPGILPPHQQRQWELPEEWEQLKAYWQLQLERLMRDFVEGRAEVDPKTPNSCRYCHLGALCRINEQAEFSEISS